MGGGGGRRRRRRRRRLLQGTDWPARGPFKRGVM